MPTITIAVSILNVSVNAMSEQKAPRPRFSYDERCEDLAEYFLSDKQHDDEQLQKLAQTIQDAVEDWLLEKEEPKP